MSERVEVRLLLARFYGDETDTPVVLGVVDRTIWDHWEDSDEEVWRDESKRRYGLDSSDLEFIEVWATFPAEALAAAFVVPVVEGAV